MTSQPRQHAAVNGGNSFLSGSAQLSLPRFAANWHWRLLLLILLSLPLGAALAQETHATVRLDGKALFRVGETAELDARARARQIEQRLAAVLENPASVPPARIGRDAAAPENRVITVGGRLVVTITSVDAEENRMTPESLALQWSQAINSGLTRAAERRLSAGDRFVTGIRAAIETAFSRMIESTTTLVPRSLAAIAVLAVFGLLAFLVRRLMRVLFRWTISDLTVENLFKQVAYYTVWLIGLIVAISAFGLEPQTFATGLGLTSLAIGFALKDILSNFVSGLLILTLRPFELGDQIAIGETEGSVERIELRATLIRTYDGRIVSVPNSETFTSRVTNNTAAPVRRASVEMFVGYDSDLREAMTAMVDAARQAEGVLEDPPPSVRVRNLGADDIVLEVRFWTDSRRSDFVSTMSRVRVAIVECFKKRGIGLPEPDLRILTQKAPSE